MTTSAPHVAIRSTTYAARVTVAVLIATAVVVIVVLGDHLSFFNDDWYFLFQRPGLESGSGLDIFLAPHNGNLVLLPAVIYKVLAAVFGLGSQLPYRIVLGLAIGSLRHGTCGLTDRPLPRQRLCWSVRDRHGRGVRLLPRLLSPQCTQ